MTNSVTFPPLTSVHSSEGKVVLMLTENRFEFYRRCRSDAAINSQQKQQAAEQISRINGLPTQTK